MNSQTTVLVVISNERRASSLMSCLGSGRLDVGLVETCRETQSFLRGCPNVDLVIADVSLPDGNWCDVVRHVVDHAERASIVVVCSDADERLWSEALWRGVYDLLVEPYDAPLVKQVIEGAMRRAHQTHEALPRPQRSETSSARGDFGRRHLAGLLLLAAVFTAIRFDSRPRKAERHECAGEAATFPIAPGCPAVRMCEEVGVPTPARGQDHV